MAPAPVVRGALDVCVLGPVTLRPESAGFSLVDIFALALPWGPEHFCVLSQARRHTVLTLFLPSASP